MTTKPKHEHCAECLKHRHRRAVDRPNPHHHKRGLPQLIAHPIETRVFSFFAHETFNLTNPGKIIVQKRVHGRRRSALQTIAAVCCQRDRKSTRLDSSHLVNSYADLLLDKKKPN